MNEEQKVKTVLSNLSNEIEVGVTIPDLSSGGTGGRSQPGDVSGMSYDTPCLQSQDSTTQNPNENNPKQTTTKKRKRNRTLSQICVVLRPEEFIQIQKDSLISGKSVPRLLKQTYFKNPFPAPLLEKEDAIKIFVELHRISSDANEIAKKLNSGIRQGFHKELEEIKELLAFLMNYVVGIYNAPKNPL